MLLCISLLPLSSLLSQPAASQPEAEQKTTFTVKLVKYGEESKVKVIKEIKAMIEGMNLVQVSALVGRGRNIVC